MDDNILGLIVTIAWSMFFSRNEVRQGKPRQQNSPILHSLISNGGISVSKIQGDFARVS